MWIREFNFLLLRSTTRNLKRTTLSASRFRFFICCYSTRKIYTVWVNEESLLFCYKTVKGYCAVCESIQTTDMQVQTTHKASPLKYRCTRNHGRIAKRFSGDRPFPCALSSTLFRLPIWRVLERRGAAEPLVIQAPATVPKSYFALLYS